MPRFYVLEIPENEAVADVAARDPVWYSAVAALEGSVITQHDKDALRVEAR